MEQCENCKSEINGKNPAIELTGVVKGKFCGDCMNDIYNDYMTDKYQDAVAAGEIIPGH